MTFEQLPAEAKAILDGLDYTIDANNPTVVWVGSVNYHTDCECCLDELRELKAEGHLASSFDEGGEGESGSAAAGPVPGSSPKSL